MILHIQGVNVLIDLGADVNAGEESEVPICLAIQSGNKDMVELVLNKGAANVQKALDLAREKCQDEIIGLLLAHIALEKSSEIVNLSGLELNRIKPTWICRPSECTIHPQRDDLAATGEIAASDR